MRFSVLQTALKPYYWMAEALGRSGAVGQNFDLRVTPIKEEGEPDRLLFELLRGNNYGIVEISEGIVVHDGSGQSVLMSTSSFHALPQCLVENAPIEFTVDSRVRIKYPDDGVMNDVNFDFEYSQDAGLFTPKEAAGILFMLPKDAWNSLRGHIASASCYVNKKRLDSPMSAVRTRFIPSSLETVIESTNGMEAFYSKQQLPGFTNYQNPDDGQAHICTLQPAQWEAGFTLANKTDQELYVGLNSSYVTFMSGKISITLNLMDFRDFPAIIETIQDWIKDSEPATFKAKINPINFRDRLKYLEQIGLAARSEEPSFVLSNRNNKPFITLKGFVSSGSAEIADANVASINWVDNKPLALPARLFLVVLGTAADHALTNFFDLNAAPSVFLTNDDNSVLVLMSKEVPSADIPV